MSFFQEILSRKRKPDHVHKGGGLYSVVNQSLLKEMERHAQADGLAMFPGRFDSEVSGYEKEISQKGASAVRLKLQEMQDRESKLEGEFIQARQDFLLAEKSYLAKRAEPQINNRPVHIQTTFTAYLLAVIPMILCEVFINFAVFETLLSGESSLTALLVSSVMGLVMLLAAHLIGGAVRQGKHRGWALLVGPLCVVTIIGLSYMRLVFTEFTNASDSGLFERPDLNATIVTIFFFLFNMTFLAVAAWLAARRHDMDETYEQCYLEYLKTRERALRFSGLRKQNVEHCLADAQDTISLLRGLVENYRQKNMNFRAIKATPHAWVEFPVTRAISMDESLFTLQSSNEIVFHD